MLKPSIRHLTTAGVVMVTVLAPVAACGSDPPVSPLPIEAASPSARPTIPVSATPTPTVRTRVPARRPTIAISPSAAPPPACMGPVTHTVQAAELALVGPLCIEVGGVLRVEGTGLGTVSVDPTEMVAPSYDGSGWEGQFILPGTVTVTVERDGQTYPIRVVVRSSPTPTG